jgi:hypothetical protein
MLSGGVPGQIGMVWWSGEGGHPCAIKMGDTAATEAANKNILVNFMLSFPLGQEPANSSSQSWL